MPVLHDIRRAPRRLLRSSAWIRRPCLALLPALALAGCAHQAPPARIQVLGSTLQYTGTIMPEAADRFLAALEAHPVATVAISSGGGEVESAMRMARAIHQRGLDVEVVGPCFSSCANYIFPAGNRKRILDGGIVGWHGNIRHMLYRHGRGEKAFSAQEVASLQRTAALEAAFFRDIGVDEFLCWAGKLPPYSAYNLYFLDLPDMERFGVRQVSASPGYAERPLARYNTGRRETIRLVRIDWATLQRPALAP